jgi:hypothetical protein
MIGDILDDVEAGERAGCHTVLVDRGNETRWRAGRLRTPRAIVYDFADAVSFILDGHIHRARRLHAVSAQAGLPSELYALTISQHTPRRSRIEPVA